jgi:hypothetical protein
MLLMLVFVLNATFSHISVLLVEETGENHRPVADKLYQLISNLAMISLDVFNKTCHTGIEFGCDRWFSPVSSTNKTEIWLKVALSTIKLTNKLSCIFEFNQS